MSNVKFKQLEKVKPLGTGSFGVVYLATDPDSKQSFAVKVLHDYEQVNSIDLQREIEVMQDVSCEFTVKYYGYIPVGFDGLPTIVMDYIPNGNLTTLVRAERFENTKKMIILYGVARGMQVLRQHKVMHRDLKPDNIMLDASYYPKITDFGFSKKTKKEEEFFTQSRKNIGTPIYCSPETLKSITYGYGNDVWSYAVTMYNVLTQKFDPYEDQYKGELEFAQKIINGMYPNLNVNIPELAIDIPETYINYKINEKGNKQDAEVVKVPMPNDFKALLYKIFTSDMYSRPTFSDVVDFFESGHSLNRVDYVEFGRYLTLIPPLSNILTKTSYLEPIYQTATEYNSNGKYLLAISLFSFLIHEYPHSPFSTKSQFFISWYYYKGIVYKKDLQKAFDILKPIFESDYPPAIYLMGLYYKSGDIVEHNIAKAEQLFALAAEKQYPPALYEMALKYKREKNLPEAFRYFDLSASFGYNHACYELGIFYAEGIYISQNVEKALSYLEPLAENDNIEAQKYLGNYFYKGSKFGTFNIYKAFYYNSRAAFQGDKTAYRIVEEICRNGLILSYKNARETFPLDPSLEGENRCFAVGLCYTYSIGCKRDVQKAITYFNRAGIKHVYAQCELGICYLSQREYNDGIPCLQLAATTQYPKALYFLGQAYFRGYAPLKSNIQQALKLYSSSAALGYIESYFRLGEIYKSGVNMILKKEYSQSFACFQQAANYGHTEALCELGIMVLDGLGCNQNQTVAISYLKRAIDQGSVKAMVVYGDCLMNGRGLPQDYNAAIALYNSAIKRGSTEGRLKLAMLYENEGQYKRAFNEYQQLAEQKVPTAISRIGKYYFYGGKYGVQQNLETAQQYFDIAKDYDDDEANYYLGLMYLNDPKMKHVAFHFFKHAASHRFAYAEFQYGICREEGIGVEMNLAKAYKLYTRAAQHGCVDALVKIGLMYQYGKGVPKDWKRAFDVFCQAANLGSLGGYINLALCYDQGIGVSKSWWSARKCRKMANEISSKMR